MSNEQRFHQDTKETETRHKKHWGFFFLVGYVEERPGGLYKAPTKEEGRKRAAKRIDR